MSLFHGEFPPLRPFQISAHEALRQGIREGHRLQVVASPTGSGKTILGMNVIKETNDHGNRAGFVCDRKTLIAQTSNVAREVGLWNHGIIQASNPLFDLSRPFQILSCQTLLRRGWPNDLNVVVVDECHTMYKTWVDHLATPPETCPRCGKKVVTDPGRPNFPRCEDTDTCRWKMPIVVGLSATPFSRGLGKIFTRLINAATMKDLTDQGILVPMRIFSCRHPDMEGAATSGGEWTDRAAEERELVLIGDVVPEWSRWANGMKTICFGSTILHCNELAKQFNEAGIPAAVICADTPDDERADLFQDFAADRLLVLCSVEALAKGFDQQDILCVIDARPLRKSFSTAVQMWGRGLRSFPGKTECRLLDFSGNIIRFADDWSDFYFNGLDKLDEGERLDQEIRKDVDHEPKACPRCGYKPMGGKKCVGCGFELQPKGLVEPLAGEMQEIKLKGGQVLAPDAPHLFAQLCTYAKMHGKPYGWVWHRFKDFAGAEPPNGWRMETAPVIEPTRTLLNKVRSVDIAWARVKAKERKGAA